MIMAISFYFFFLFFFLHPTVNSLSFNIPRFNTDGTNILLEGDAVTKIGTIEFNQVQYSCRVGRATFAERVHLWDSATGKLSDFTTHFSFSIDTQGAPSASYGHGLAFFLAPVGYQIPPNSAAGFLGLFNTTTIDTTSNNKIIVVEFDSFVNPEWDPPVQHVGINNNSIGSAVFVPWNASLHSRDTGNAWITYNSTTKNLSVFWTYEQNPIFKGNSLLSYQVDLMQVLPEWVTVGFSATTGQFGERHTLESWEFNSSLETKEKKGNNARKIGLGVGLSVSGAVLMGGAAVVWMIMSKKRRARRKSEETVNLTSINGDFERGAGPKRFSLRELVSATNNFSEERKLGEGGFGGVYRGFLSDLDLEVAVKKISRGSRQGKKEYITEVKIISRLRHRNLVQLIGWCHEKSEFLLVYELMPNGSLDSHIFGKRTPLIWAVRYKIALGLASALLYLHEEWEQCVVHRDVKSSNVMLDSNFNAKLGDFGLARLMDHELGAPQTTGLAGTFGYLAPEYINTGKASKESDVFSFGVVAIEIVCGRKSVDPMEEESQVGLVEWAWDLYGKGNILAAVDKRLSMDFDAKQVECLMSVGLWCAHPDRSLRPSIRQAIQVLNMEASVPNLPPKMPVPLYHVPAGGAITSSEPSSLTCTSLDVGR